MKKPKPPKAPWRNRFLNVVERTFIELNIEFNNYSLGQAANAETKKRIFDSTVQGIEFADELTVCSAIVNDCMASPIMSGDVEKHLEKDGQPELKFYKVNRETRYSEEHKHRVDITVQRVSYEQIIEKSGGRLTTEQFKKSKESETVFIEAKRAKRYPNSTLDQIEKFDTGLTASSFKTDTEYRVNKYSLKGRFFYVLVWGVYNSTEKDNTPKNYLKSFRKSTIFTIKPIDVEIRWIPLSWKLTKSPKPPSKNQVVEKWCWILLAQISKK